MIKGQDCHRLLTQHRIDQAQKVCGAAESRTTAKPTGKTGLKTTDQTEHARKAEGAVTLLRVEAGLPQVGARRAGRRGTNTSAGKKEPGEGRIDREGPRQKAGAADLGRLARMHIVHPGHGGMAKNATPGAGQTNQVNHAKPAELSIPGAGQMNQVNHAKPAGLSDLKADEAKGTVTGNEVTAVSAETSLAADTMSAVVVGATKEVVEAEMRDRKLVFQGRRVSTERGPANDRSPVGDESPRKYMLRIFFCRACVCFAVGGLCVCVRFCLPLPGSCRRGVPDRPSLVWD